MATWKGRGGGHAPVHERNKVGDDVERVAQIRHCGLYHRHSPISASHASRIAMPERSISIEIS
eukprot:2247240-Rhodomonas_salina.3